ncbi:MAG TPA: glycosyltransferase [Williamwhitmania sp.]|nr:glycosyltransferase [Williamwhitmania sp.]
MTDQELVTVSVLMTTYNHGRFIEEAIQGVLIQQYSFRAEFIIADDASLDNNQSLIAKLSDRYPELLNPILRKKNIGAHLNWNDALTRSEGKYIAICEGDDFWNSPEKLQKQVDILEANPEVGLVFSNFNIKEKHRTIRRVLKTVPSCIDKPDELLISNPIATCTIVCRRDLLNEAQALLGERRFAMGDYPIWLYIAQKSKLAYIDEPFATYRIVGGSATNQGYHRQLAFLESQQEVKEFFMERFSYSEPVQQRVKLEYLQKKLMLCFLTNKRDELDKCAKSLTLLKGKLTLRERIYAIASRILVVSMLLKKYHNLYHKFRQN